MKVTKLQSYKVTSKKTKQVFFSFVIFFFLFFFTGDWKLVTGDLVFADQIRIRTIITPVGSQSEKWGAAGLMVCIGGEPINVGGCGIYDVIGVNKKNAEGTETIDIEQQFCDTTSAEEYCNKMIFFVDDGDHQFGNGDTIYEVIGEKDCSCTDVPGATECWIDVDGDGYTPFTGDCNETCSTCYAGSTATTASPDGYDQDCNGIVDDSATSACEGSNVWGYDNHCNWVKNGQYYAMAGENRPYGPCSPGIGGCCNCWLEALPGNKVSGGSKDCEGWPYFEGVWSEANTLSYRYKCGTREAAGGYR